MPFAQLPILVPVALVTLCRIFRSILSFLATYPYKSALRVSKSALEVHGYTDKFLSDKRKFAEVADEFLNFINGRKIIIHNADFDISHLKFSLKFIHFDP